MSLLYKRKSRVSSATRASHNFHARKRRLKYKVCGLIERIYRKEKARIAGAIIISGIITEEQSFHPSRLQDFPNYFSILLIFQ